MRKIALMLVVALVLSASMCVFVSAEDAVITSKPVVFYGLDENGNIYQSDETNTDNDLGLEVPSDMIAVAYEFDTNGIGFAAYHFVLNYDNTKFRLLGVDYDAWALTAESETNLAWCKKEMSDDFEVEPYGYSLPVLDKLAVNKDIKDSGRVSVVHGQATNYKNRGKNITSGVGFIIYLEVTTKDACDTDITASYIEVSSQDKITYVGEGESVTVKLNGGAPEATPVTIAATNSYVYAAGATTLSSWKMGATLGDINAAKDHNYWGFAVLAWDAEAGVYKVAEVRPRTAGADHRDIAIPEYGFLLGAHGDSENCEVIANLNVGDVVYIYGEDLPTTAAGQAINAVVTTVADDSKTAFAPHITAPVTVNINYNYNYAASVTTLSSWKMGATLGDINAAKDHNFWAFAVLAWDAEAGVYKVDKVCPFQSASDYRSLEIPEYGFLLGVHGNLTDTCDAVASLVEGDVVYIYGDDLLNTTKETASNAVVTTVADSNKTAFAPQTATAIKSLGASVRESDKAIRFGARYTKIEANGVADGLGMLLLPKAKLGDNTLDLDYANANSIVANVLAKGVSEGYVEGQQFADYETFVFCVTLLGLEGHEDAEIVAVPYITYDSGAVEYGEALVRSYNYVSENQPVWPAE